VVRIAQAAAIPVLVDAAAELPPRGNLRRFIEEGADLVAFSGGKSIGGPSASGILCGRKQLIASALLQQLDLDYVSDDWRPPSQLIDRSALRGVPRHGIGRSCKVGKEQIIGLLTALERFAGEDDGPRNARFAIVIDALLQSLSPLGRLRVQRVADGGHGDMPLLEVRVVPEPGAPSALELAARLRSSSPSVHVDATNADTGVLMLVPTCLKSEDAAAIAAAFDVALDAASEDHDGIDRV
jgi:D-glucosaminate-6-phosphate ammonia-lyase